MTIDKWTSGADYDQWMGRWSQLVAEEFLSWLGLTPRLRYLDVCCGSGVLTEAIVERLAPARVVGIDASAKQIRFARAHRGGPGINFEIGDALHLPFAADSFDIAVCGLGLNYVPEAEGALREMRRVTVPKGIIAGYVWDFAEGTRFLREFWDAAAAVDGEALRHDQARRFPWCNPVALRELFARAGLKEVEVTALVITTRFTSFDDYWQPLQTGQGSAPNYLASRSEGTRDAIRERLRQSLPTDAQGGIALPARAWGVRGRR
jgi:ubiquinone/menaquinone biosynthesis C-methylase UbiE